MMGSIAAGRQVELVLKLQLRAHISMKNKGAHQQPAMGGGLLPLSAELSPTDGLGERRSRYY